MRHEFASCFSLPCSLKADVYNENALKKFAALQNTNLPCILRVYKRKNQTNAFLERKKLPRLQSLKHWLFPLVMQQLDCCFAGASACTLQHSDIYFLFLSYHLLNKQYNNHESA